MIINGLCVDYGSRFCPCILAETGGCVVCSQAGGKAYLHCDAEFQTLMQEARKEYQSTTPSAIQAVTSSDSRRAAIYTLDGRRVYDKPARKGIYISDGKKEVSGK